MVAPCPCFPAVALRVEGSGSRRRYVAGSAEPCALVACLQVSCMPRLQHVELHVPGGSSRRPVNLAPWLEHLPAQQLTRLVLKPLARRDLGRCAC